MARATSSLPVPDSPVTSRLACEADTRRMRAKISCIAAERPMMLSSRSRRLTSSRKRVTSLRSERSASALSMLSRSWSILKGLVM